MEGADCVGGQEKEWTVGFLLDDLRAFVGINANQWATAAQDKGVWRKTAEQEGAERFMAKWVAACRESQGWTTACSSMPKREGKDQGQGSPKQACSCWFARHHS